MSILSKSAEVLTVLSLGFFFTQAVAQNFCNAAGYSGTSVQVNGNKTGTINGIGYEQWADQGNNTTTFYEDGSFKCSFSGTKDFLCRAGKSYDKTQTWQQLGHLYADFSVSINNMNNVGYSYIGIYGWTVQPLVEFYIVDTWGSPYPPNPGDYKGTITVDGATYKLYYHRQIQQPSIEGTTDFDQYFSVRETKRECGTIDITAHFQAWANKMNWTMGKMHEAKVLGEAGGGNTSGRFDFNYAKVYVDNGTNPSSSSSGPSSSATVERSPYSSNSIPGTIEFENFDKGGEGVGYHNGNYSGDYSPSGYRSEEVEVIGVGSGYGVGYISADDWLEYMVKVASAGTYDFEVTAGTGMSTASVINVTAGTATAEVSIPATPDDWNEYSTTKGTINLAAGSQIIRFTFTSGNVNIDKVKFTKKSTTSSSSTQQSSSSSAKPSSSSKAQSSSSFVIPSSSSEEKSSSSVWEISSATMESSSSTLEISSSSAELWYSSATMAMAKTQSLVDGDRNLLVFDMQGRFMGKVTVAQGASPEQTLFAKFQKPGIYLVKQGSRFMQVRVTR